MSHVLMLKNDLGEWVPIPTIKGDTGDQGPTGPKGDKGDTGIGLQVKGTYATLAALQAAVTDPDIGDMYNVGSAAPFNIYMWNGNAWENQGQLQGPKGDKGDPGQDGADGADGAPGPNEISTDTASGIAGLLKGADGKVAAAVAGTDYAAPAVDYTAALSTAWTGSGPYTQAVTVTGLSASAKIFVGLADNATDAEYAAAAAAQLMCTAKAANQITVTARGAKPTIAIPIIVRVVG